MLVMLTPLPLPEKVWESISMDFVKGLLVNRGKSAILVVMDCYSMFAHFATLLYPYTAPKVAQIFMDEVFRLYGLPSSIISDRDSIFLSGFQAELFKLQGTQLGLCSSYHSQTNGQTERFNQCLECYLRCFCSLKPTEWWKWIPWPCTSTILHGDPLLALLHMRLSTAVLLAFFSIFPRWRGCKQWKTICMTVIGSKSCAWIIQ